MLTPLRGSARNSASLGAGIQRHKRLEVGALLRKTLLLGERAVHVDLQPTARRGPEKTCASTTPGM